MSERRTQVTPELQNFLSPHWEAVDPLILQIQADIHKREKYPMQISLEQVVLHGWLCRLIKARAVLEVGTYLGLSAAGFALALPDDGHVDTIEISDENADIAEGWFHRGGLQDKITVHRGPALEAIRGLPGPYDLCFLDGDKGDNLPLLKVCIDRVRQDGLIMVDNAFQDGRVAASNGDDAVAATRAALEFARTSDQLDAVLLPVADGLLVCRRV